MTGLNEPTTGTFQQAVIQFKFVCGKQIQYGIYEAIYTDKSCLIWVFPDWSLRKVCNVESFFHTNPLSFIADELKEKTRQAMQYVCYDKRCKNWELVETKILGELNIRSI